MEALGQYKAVFPSQQTMRFSPSPGPQEGAISILTLETSQNIWHTEASRKYFLKK
jgi:hypothetical protein